MRAKNNPLDFSDDMRVRKIPLLSRDRAATPVRKPVRGNPKGDSVPLKFSLDLAVFILDAGAQEAATQTLIYWPLKRRLALMIAPMRALKFSASFGAGKENLTDGAVDDVGLVETILRPYRPLTPEQPWRRRGVTVLGLSGDGIRPQGPSTLPRRPTTPIMSGEATTTSKSNQFSFWIFSTRSISPT